MRTPVTVLITVVALATLAGCGGDRSGRASTSSSSAGSSPSAGTGGPRSTPTPPGAQLLPKALRLPSGVPTTSDGSPADAVSARVIRKWSGALTGGDIKRAARFFALPSKVQNGTPVVTLDTAEKRLVFNITFPCGAKPTKLEQGTGGFTVVDFRLVKRKGGDCGSGTGGTARCAIRVKDGHIADWYRIPETGSGPVPQPAPQGPPESSPNTQIA